MYSTTEIDNLNGYFVKEQRRAQRFEMTLPVTLLRTGRADTQEGQTRNLSSCGVYFVVPEKLELGTLLEFAVAFPAELAMAGAVRLVCKGKVTRVEQKEEALVGVAATIERYEFVREPAN